PAAAANAETKAEVEAASKGRGANVEAYQLYLQGRFLIDRQTREDRPKGIAYLRRALELDPENALAWAGLSIAYSNQSGTNWAQFMGGVEPAREAAQKALRLQADLAEGHLALGIVANLFGWNWKSSDAAVGRALEL